MDRDLILPVAPTARQRNRATSSVTSSSRSRQRSASGRIFASSERSMSSSCPTSRSAFAQSRSAGCGAPTREKALPTAFSMAFMVASCWRPVESVMQTPFLPARPVRPLRWMYVSTSARPELVLGGSQLITSVICVREREKDDALDVQAARGDVRGHQTAELALLEVLQRLLARLLRDVAVENARLRWMGRERLTMPRRHSSPASSLQRFFMSQKTIARPSTPQ